MRNLMLVRKRLLAAIEDEGARLEISEATQSIADSFCYAPPEMGGHWWAEFAAVLNEEMQPYVNEPWFPRTVRIINGQE
jgi:hypothetical protein